MATRYTPTPKPGTNDLEILNPDQRVPVGSQLWTVREYSFLESAGLMDAGRRVSTALRNGGENLAVLELVSLLALATRESPTRIAALPQAVFDQLASTWLAVNGPAFASVAESRGKVPRWGDVYALLIAHGHDPRRIAKYTQRQITLYFECAHRLDGRRSADRIRDVNFGTNGGKPAQDALKQLTSD